VSLHLQVAMASQISKIETKIKTEEGVEGGMSRRPEKELIHIDMVDLT
jgi:hypothetical protein